MSLMQTPLIVIPARLAATRLPNKPLADILGKPMIIHVWERALQAHLGPVIVACGDQEIYEVVMGFGGMAILTDPLLPSGSDRVKAAVDIFDPQGIYSHIINVQGDVPTLDPELLRACLDPFLIAPNLDIATLATEIQETDELADPNVVKIALGLEAGSDIGRALYFSRNVVPSGEGPHYHHVGLYAYSRKALNRYVTLPVHPLESHERLEQLRALAHGMTIHVKVISGEVLFGVDTQSDLDRAIAILDKKLKFE
ncbi:3-deoxy-manno-octulosonate cytidylyltransferase [Candidatus Bealeia paramacronuclearis]|uniref:3-deoxy-manno-octulosonate cytidylyltransferase n=1 Tax=Candidatus Bealeia paramacronuclearis TaxID=1921001 RepID=A0ABZ2C279_9PROT|nr:3-deoxy-manno-octulosonate cytidylyltransferase [Candidatus Bealeia paramacronuclearis]